MTSLEIVNAGFLKLGGAGGQFGASPFLPNLTATDDLTVQSAALYARARKKAIIDLALRKCPFKESVKFADLGTELTQYDLAIDDISVSGTTITVTTSDVHSLTTGDTRYLTGIRGTGGIESLNNALYTVTVVTTTTFTLNSTTGSTAWVYTDNTGKVSQVPEIGEWEYAFILPSDCIVVVRNLNESFSSTQLNKQEYRFDIMRDRAGTGKILVTNDLSNYAGDSAFIEYCIDQTETTIFSEALIECIACLFAAEICPLAGKDLATRNAKMLEYIEAAIPDALRFNGSQMNNWVKTQKNYLGNRS